MTPFGAARAATQRTGNPPFESESGSSYRTKRVCTCTAKTRADMAWPSGKADQDRRHQHQDQARAYFFLDPNQCLSNHSSMFMTVHLHAAAALRRPGFLDTSIPKKKGDLCKTKHRSDCHCSQAKAPHVEILPALCEAPTPWQRSSYRGSVQLQALQPLQGV